MFDFICMNKKRSSHYYYYYYYYYYCATESSRISTFLPTAQLRQALRDTPVAITMYSFSSRPGFDRWNLMAKTSTWTFCRQNGIPSSRFSNLPDIVLVDGSKISTLKLTICHETNLAKSRQFKKNKYENIRVHLQPHLTLWHCPLWTLSRSKFQLLVLFRIFLTSENQWSYLNCLNQF